MAPALRPQGRGGQGVAGAHAARRLQAAARTIPAARSAMFAGGVAALLQGCPGGWSPEQGQPWSEGGPHAGAEPGSAGGGVWVGRREGRELAEGPQARKGPQGREED